jgi:hypothetical protein
MTHVRISSHAISRYRERVAPRLTMAEAIEALSSPTIRRAAEFGAAYVRLGAGQRIALDGFVVVTVLPRDQRVRCLGVRRQRAEVVQEGPA